MTGWSSNNRGCQLQHRFRVGPEPVQGHDKQCPSIQGIHHIRREQEISGSQSSVGIIVDAVARRRLVA